jgi:hypothetical protein
MPKLPTSDPESAWEVKGNHRREIRQFAKAFSQMDDRNQTLLVDLAQKMARRHSKV